jgi:hypothetical protein
MTEYNENDPIHLKSGKCEWKDGKYEPCEKFNGKVKSHMLQNSDYYEFRCCSCGADIRKPEPEEPTIKKSGETWVAKTIYGDSFYDGYSETEPERTDKKWKMISDKDGKQLIEITDEIAKLRPMVVSPKGIRKLWGGVNKWIAILEINHPSETGRECLSHCSIATVSDLED